MNHRSQQAAAGGSTDRQMNHMRLSNEASTATLTWSDQEMITIRPRSGEAAPIVAWRPVAEAAGSSHEYTGSMDELGPVRIHEPRASIALRYLFPWAAHPSILRALDVDDYFRKQVARNVGLMLKAIDMAQLDPSREYVELDVFDLTTYLETVYKIGAAIRFERPVLSADALPGTILRALYEHTYATFPHVPAAEARLLAHGVLWTAVYGFTPATAVELGIEPSSN